MSKNVSREMANDKKIDFAVGGQALIEGVMMRSPNYIAMAVRKQDNSIKIHDWPFASIIGKYKWLNIPILRGAINMVEMLIVGMKAMNLSAEEAIETTEEIEQNKQKNETIDSHKTSYWSELFNIIVFGLNIIFALAFALLIFKFVPLYITEFLREQFPAVASSNFLYNLIDGALKLIIFISYVIAIGLIPSINRVFQYHAAEHMAVFAYENTDEVNVPNSAKQSRFHPRCGTSFIFLVIITSIVIYTLVPRNPVFWLQFLQRFAILPIIAGVGYEILKWSAKHQGSLLVRFFTRPGLWFQRLTTRPAKEDQLEVSVAALNRTLELEAAKSNSGTDAA